MNFLDSWEVLPLQSGVTRGKYHDFLFGTDLMGRKPEILGEHWMAHEFSTGVFGVVFDQVSEVGRNGQKLISEFFIWLDKGMDEKQIENLMTVLSKVKFD